MTHRHYHNPEREVIYFPSSAFGATTESKKLLGPRGKKGVVRDIVTILTADAVGTTTVPEINVGTAAGLFEYARHRLGTSATAGNTAAGSPYRAQPLVGGNGDVPKTLSDFAGHISLETALLPADTAFVITRKAGTGGTPAGTGETWVTIDWF
jgi:hypothetical protein